MRPRLILVSLGLLAVAFLSFTLQAQQGSKQNTEPAQAAKFSANQQQLQHQYKEFKEMLFKLKQKNARGSAEEKKLAEHLDKILQKCDELAITQEFAKMDEMLKTAKINTTDGLRELETQSAEITKRLDTVFEMFKLGTTELMSRERQELSKLLKELQIQIDAQKQLEPLLQRGKTDPKELQELQKKEAEKTAKLAKKIEELLKKDGDKNGKGGEANPQGQVKDAGKTDGKKGESKGDGANKEQKGSESPRGESRDGGKDSQTPKGESKPGEKSPNTQPKTGNDKGEPKADSKPGSESKSGKEGSPSPNSKESKSGAKGSEGSAKESKSGQSGKEAKPGDSKDAGNKPGDKTGDKKDADKGAAKGDDKQGSESSPSSPSDSKEGSPSSESKPGSPSPGGAGQPSPKNNSPKSGQVDGGSAKGGDAKGEASKGGQGQIEVKNGTESQGQSSAKNGGADAPANQSNPQGNQASQKGDNSPPPPGGESGGDKKKDDNSNIANSKKKIEEAGYDQSQAADNIAKDKKENKIVAGKQQADAIKKMEEAKKKLERLLNQLREEEMERVLAALQARCEKMLRMQQVVLADTERVDTAIDRNKDKMPNRENKAFSLNLAGEEKKIVEEANKCIDILQAEGSAVAFPEVFQQVRDDMLAVQKRLEVVDPGQKTQNIEKDIIDTLKEMIEALKKARDELKDPGKSPPPGSGGGQPGDQKLLELIQELKMVRSLQKRVNDRTKDWGRNAEQAQEMQTIRELRNLSERQRRIQEIVDRIAKGANQ